MKIEEYMRDISEAFTGKFACFFFSLAINYLFILQS